MAAKVRMPESLEAVFECEVKNLYNDEVKVLWLRADIYEKLLKEMQIKVLKTIKPEGVTWQQHQESGTQSQKDEPDPAPEQVDIEVSSDTPEAEEALAQDEVVAEVAPPPPAQDTDQASGESDHDFRVRRMKEGKARAQWERDYGMKAEDYDDYVKQQIEDASMEALDKGV